MVTDSTQQKMKFAQLITEDWFRSPIQNILDYDKSGVANFLTEAYEEFFKHTDNLKEDHDDQRYVTHKIVVPGLYHANMSMAPEKDSSGLRVLMRYQVPYEQLRGRGLPLKEVARVLSGPAISKQEDLINMIGALESIDSADDFKDALASDPVFLQDMAVECYKDKDDANKTIISLDASSSFRTANIVNNKCTTVDYKVSIRGGRHDHPAGIDDTLDWSVEFSFVIYVDAMDNHLTDTPYSPERLKKIMKISAGDKSIINKGYFDGRHAMNNEPDMVMDIDTPVAGKYLWVGLKHVPGTLYLQEVAPPWVDFPDSDMPEEVEQIFERIVTADDALKETDGYFNSIRKDVCGLPAIDIMRLNWLFSKMVNNNHRIHVTDKDITIQGDDWQTGIVVDDAGYEHVVSSWIM